MSEKQQKQRTPGVWRKYMTYIKLRNNLLN